MVMKTNNISESATPVDPKDKFLESVEKITSWNGTPGNQDLSQFILKTLEYYN